MAPDIVAWISAAPKIADGIGKLIQGIKGLLKKEKDPVAAYRNVMTEAEQMAATEAEKERIRQYLKDGEEYIKIFFANLDENNIPAWLTTEGKSVSTILTDIKMYKTLRGKSHPWDSINNGNVFSGDTTTTNNNTGIAGEKTGETMDKVMNWVKSNPLMAAGAALVLWLILGKKKLF